MVADTTPKHTLKGIAQRLVLDQLIDEKTAVKAQKQAEQEKIPLVLYLAQKKTIDGEKLALTTAQDFGLPLFDLDSYDPEFSPIELVSQALIQKHRVLPLYRRGDRLYIATYDPTNQAAQEVIQFHTGLYVHPIVASPLKLEKVIDAIITDKEASLLEDVEGEDLESLESIDISGDDEEENLSGDSITKEKTEKDAPIIRYVHKVLLDAIKKNASDVHFEPYENTYRIRFRIDGVLYETATPSLKMAPRITARLKVMSNLDISERRLPQDGRFKLKLSKKRGIDFRISTCPTVGGEKVVVRLLETSNTLLGVDSLGFEKWQKEKFLRATEQPHGMILVTGPTGSGKTVTLYTALNILNSPGKNISTAEDPVEIHVQGINQVNINPKAGLHFAEILRSFLRQDPDIIMVGEMRDQETAEIGVKAAQTGHLVLSTLHTNSAAETLTRLRYMGVEPFNIASSVELIIAQRLARKLCENCKKTTEVPDDVLLEEGFDKSEIKDLKLYAPVGCEECTEGYRGRIGIFEVLPITQKISRLIMEQCNALDIEQAACEEGMHTLRQSGLLKVKSGITSLTEINRITRD